MNRRLGLIAYAGFTQLLFLLPFFAFAQTGITASLSFNRDLKLGSTDLFDTKDVSLLQELLSKNKRIYPEGVVSGIYGTATTKAVQRFQYQYGISEDVAGKVGSSTRSYLNALSETRSAQEFNTEVITAKAKFDITHSSVDRTNLVNALVRRKEEFKKIILVNPKKALELQLPSATRKALPSDLQVFTESNVTFNGYLGIEHADYPALDFGTFIPKLVIGTSSPFTVSIAKGRALRPGQVQINGLAMDTLIVSSDVLFFTPFISFLDTPYVQGTPQPNIAVVLLTYPDITVPSFSTTQATQLMQKVDAYYQDVSYGKNHLNFKIFGPYRASKTFGKCNFYFEDALLAADPYIDFRTFSNVLYILPNNSTCNWAGLSSVGPYSISTGEGALLIRESAVIGWDLNDPYQHQVTVHELGHSFNLWHAGHLSCPSTPLAANLSDCHASDYGDYFDAMGAYNAGHFNAKQKSLINILGSSILPQQYDPAVTQSGYYFLKPLEIAPGATFDGYFRGLQIPAGPSSNLTSRMLYVEYRQPLGMDSILPATTTDGAIVRFNATDAKLDIGDDTFNLDMSPFPKIFPEALSSDSNVVLRLGQVFQDPVSGIQITVTERTTDELTLKVAIPGSPFSPVTKVDLKISPASNPFAVTDGPLAVPWGSNVFLVWNSNGSFCDGYGYEVINGTTTVLWNSRALPINGAQQVGPLTGPLTARIICNGTGGIGSDNVSASIIPNSQPKVVISADTRDIPSLSNPTKRSATISWTATNVASCNASGAWSGPKNTTGTYNTGILVPQTNFYDLSYNLSCIGTYGNASGVASVRVSAYPYADLKGSASSTGPWSDGPVTIPYNSPAYVKWTTVNVSSCAKSGSLPIGGFPLYPPPSASGTTQTAPLSNSGSYAANLSCSGSLGSSTDLLSVYVSPPGGGTPDLMVTFIAASPVAPELGQQTRLWATVRNQGTAPAPSSWLQLRPINESLPSTYYTPYLFPGEATTVTRTWTPTTAGPYTIAARADFFNQIPEFNELNNTTTISLAVPTPLAPGITVGDRIRTTTSVSVRSSGSATASILGTQPMNSTGTLLQGPIYSGGDNWWRVDYLAGVDGWSPQSQFTEAFNPRPATSTFVMSSPLLATTTLVVNGSSTNFLALITNNTDKTYGNIALDKWIEQGTTKYAASNVIFRCATNEPYTLLPLSIVPPGLCVTTSTIFVDSNLLAGSATFVTQLSQLWDPNPLATYRIPVKLVKPLATESTYMSLANILGTLSELLNQLPYVLPLR